MKKIIAVVGISVLTGCAINSGVVPVGQGNFMVTRQAATGFAGMGNLRAEAMQEATQFCSTQPKKAIHVASTSQAQPPYVLGNFPWAEVQFSCQ